MNSTRPLSSANHDPAVADRESAFFNRVVTKSGDFNPFADRGWATLARRFRKMVRPAKAVTVLDIGCGTGQSRQMYIRHCSRYVGIDLAERAIEIARQSYPFSEWQVGNACALPFENGTFDIITYSSVLHHIPDFAQALVEGHRVLRNGGAVFAFDPNVFHPAMALFRHPQSPFYIAQGVSPNERPLRPAALRQAFGQAGFKSIRQRCQANIPYRRVAPKLINACLGLYNGLDWLMERSGLARWFGTFVVTCGKKI
jgi:ubiquinone/menaquinone biosynthesis C-methylase UbiE